jgi:hypothetical protein
VSKFIYKIKKNNKNLKNFFFNLEREVDDVVAELLEDALEVDRRGIELRVRVDELYRV